MIENGIAIFAIYFASIIALICSIYVALIERRRRREFWTRLNKKEEN